MEERCSKSDEDEKLSEVTTYSSLTPMEADEILVDLVKGYSHLYDKESQDFKDSIKRNKSWTDISHMLNTTPEICQARWVRLRERYSREKKIREIKAKDNKAISRPSFALYERMSFLHKFVKSRKSFTYKQSQSGRKQVFSSNISSHQMIQLIPTKRVSRKELQPIITPISVVPTYVSQSAPHFRPTIGLSNVQLLPIKSRSACKIDSSSAASVEKSNFCTSVACKVDVNDKRQEPTTTQTEKLRSKNSVSSTVPLSEVKREVVSPVPSDRDTSSPALSVASSSGKSSNLPRRFKSKATPCHGAVPTDSKIEESFVKLTTVLTQYFENKNQSFLCANESGQEDSVFGKIVVDQLRKISEPEKTAVKGQIMKILYKL